MQQENPNVSTGVFLGIDAGSVTTKAVALAPDATLLAAAYVPAAGAPVASLEAALRQLKAVLGEVPEVVMSAATGSARHLVEKAVGVDILCNEITCQAVAAVREVPDVRTIIEIGGQDSKIIFIRDCLVTDFAMNTICAPVPVAFWTTRRHDYK